jgi:hypothetical protein
VMFSHNVVDQELRRIRQYKSGDSVDDHQDEADQEQSSARTHQFPDFWQNCLQSLDLGGLGSFFSCGAQSLL